MLATLAELKASLSISDTSQDTLLTSCLTQANGLIAGYIGDDLSDTEDKTEVQHRPVGSTFLHLSKWPVISVHSVTIDGSDFEDYTLDPRSGSIFFDCLPGQPSTRMGHEVVSVYSGGYAAADIPGDLKMVCLNIASTIYNNGGTVAQTAGGNELKSLTMFDAMSMSFDTSSSPAHSPEGLVSTWAFILNKYRLSIPVLK